MVAIGNIQKRNRGKRLLHQGDIPCPLDRPRRVAHAIFGNEVDLRLVGYFLLHEVIQRRCGAVNQKNGTGLGIESFDVAHFSGVLAYQKQPLTALKLAYRVLKPGGLVAVREPEKEGDWFATSFGPFCSKRCRLIDLGKWLGEEHAISEPLRPGHFKGFEDLRRHQAVSHHPGELAVHLFGYHDRVPHPTTSPLARRHAGTADRVRLRARRHLTAAPLKHLLS